MTDETLYLLRNNGLDIKTEGQDFHFKPFDEVKGPKIVEIVALCHQDVLVDGSLGEKRPVGTVYVYEGESEADVRAKVDAEWKRIREKS